MTYKVEDLLKQIEKQELELIGYRAAMKMLQKHPTADLYVFPINVSFEMASKQHLSGPKLAEVSISSASRRNIGAIKRVIDEGEVVTLSIPFQKL